MQIAAPLIVGALLLALSGCGGSQAPSSPSSATPPEPPYTPEAFTHRQQLIEEGARLAVADGCTACHLVGRTQSLGPSFSSFAGHDVTLADGRRVLVDQRFLAAALLHPDRYPLRGYEAGPMLTALSHLNLARRPEQLSALIAFIEQIGPEAG